MNMNKFLLLFLFFALGCSGGNQEETIPNSVGDVFIPNDEIQENQEFALTREVFSLTNNQENIISETVILSETSNYTWSLSKNVDYGTLSLNKNNNNLIFNYTPNLTINNVLDTFSIKIRYIEDDKIKEKNFLIKIEVGEVSDSTYSGGGQNEEDNEEIFKITWKTVINKPDKSSFNEKVVDSNFPKILSYEIIKDVCKGDIFYNKVNNSIFISYTPSEFGTESIRLKITQEKENGTLLVEEKDIFLNIGGVSAPRSCNSVIVDEEDEGNPEEEDEEEVIISNPEESHSWILEHYFYNTEIQEEIFFTSTFQNFFSYEIVKQPCSGNLNITKQGNSLKFNYSPESNYSGTESFVVKVRQKRAENVDLIVQKEIIINIMQSGEINNPCLDSGGNDSGEGGDSGSGEEGGDDEENNSGEIIINNPIIINSWNPQIINIITNNLENPNFTFNIKENPCKGEFSVSTSGRNIVLSYDPLDFFYGTQSFLLEYIFYNEENILEKQEIRFFININGESQVDNSCRESSDGENGEGTGGGVVGGGGNSGNDGNEAGSCDPLVIEGCDDGVTENPEEIVDLGYDFTFIESVLIPQNEIYNGDFGIGTPPGFVEREIVSNPKKGIIEFNPDMNSYKYTPYKNHVGNDSFKVRFSPSYGEHSGGVKTFYIKIKATRDSLSFDYVGFTSEPDYINVIDKNDPLTLSLASIDNLFFGKNIGNDYFISINPDNILCPSLNSNYYFSKIFGESEANNLAITYGSLWECQHGVTYLNEEKIIFNNGKHLLLGFDNSVYLGVKRDSAIDNTLDYLNFNYNSFRRIIISYKKGENRSLIESSNLFLNISGNSYINLGNGYFSIINSNNYGGYYLSNIYSYNSANNQMVLVHTENELGSFVLIENNYYIFTKEYYSNGEALGATLQLIDNL